MEQPNHLAPQKHRSKGTSNPIQDCFFRFENVTVCPSHRATLPFWKQYLKCLLPSSDILADDPRLSSRISNSAAGNTWRLTASLPRAPVRCLVTMIRSKRQRSESPTSPTSSTLLTTQSRSQDSTRHRHLVNGIVEVKENHTLHGSSNRISQPDTPVRHWRNQQGTASDEGRVDISVNLPTMLFHWAFLRGG